MINICKECGEPFEATSARIKYCSKIHYRPCPICGKPVEAKYLSDPPRKCEDCKGKKSVPKAEPTPAPEPVKEVTKPIEHEHISEDDLTYADVREYVGPPVSVGFIPGHKYVLDVDRHDGLYWISASKDLTEGKCVDLLITYSSQIGVDLRFKKVEKI